MIRRSVLFPVAALAVVLIVGPHNPALTGLGWAFVGGAVLEATVSLWEGAQRERRLNERAEELREWESMLDIRAQSYPGSTFGTQETARDDDGWPVPLTPMTWEPRGTGISDGQDLPRQHGTLAEHHRRLRAMMPKPAPDFHRREHDLSLRDRVLLWLDLAADRVVVWLRVHEPKRFWHDYELGRHSAGGGPLAMPEPAPVLREIRWADPVEDDTPTLLRFDFDTAAWSTLDEWQSEGLQAVGAP